MADEVYGTMLQTSSEDGAVSQEVPVEFLEQVKRETGVRRTIAVTNTIHYLILREIEKELGE